MLFLTTKKFKQERNFLMLNINNQYWMEFSGVQHLLHFSASAVGITNTEAKIRLTQFDNNIIGVIKKRNLVLQFLSRFSNSLLLVSVFASLPFKSLGAYFG